jgi:hypothetical protein
MLGVSDLTDTCTYPLIRGHKRCSTLGYHDSGTREALTPGTTQRTHVVTTLVVVSKPTICACSAAHQG